ncbi:MAG: hypothetical protein WAV30_01845 [Microgenomates group bacterium]
MHAFVFAPSVGPQGIPQALLPIKGRSVIDYLLDDIFDQKDITSVTILTTESLTPLLKKHLQNTYGDKPIKISADRTLLADTHDDVLICRGVVHSSLKMQDFIRAFKQHKTAITAEYQKEEEHIHIPHFIIPKDQLSTYVTQLLEDGLLMPDVLSTMRIQNTGTGFCYEASSLTNS